METTTPQWRAVLLPVAFALLCAILTLLTFRIFGGSLPLDPKGYRVELPLPQAQNVVVGSDVQMSGVKIGRVVDVRLSGRAALAEVEIRSPFAPLRTDTSGMVRSKTLLGEGYIELAPGRASAPFIPEGGQLAADRVGPSVQFDEFLSTFDNATRDRLKVLFAGVATAFDGRGTELNTAAAELPVFANGLEGVTTAVSDQTAELQQLFASSADVLDALGRRSGALQAAVRNGNAVFSTTAQRDRELSATIEALPPFLRQLHQTADSIKDASDDLRPAVAALRPVAPLVAPALLEIEANAPSFTRLFRQLPATMAAGENGLPALQRILEAVPAAFDGLYPASRETISLAKLLARYRRGAVIGTISNLAAQTNTKLVLPGGKVISGSSGAITLWNESVGGWVKKLPSSRSNSYPKPDAFDRLSKTGFLESFDCRHVNNPNYLPPLGSGSPPCVTQGPWKFDGTTAFYPRLQRAPE